MNDACILKQCHFNCRIGITAEERQETQPVIVDVTLYFDTKKAAETDDIAATIDYRAVHDLLKNFLEKMEFKLLETLANRTATLLLKEFPIERVFLHVEKPEPMQKRGGAWVGFEITRP